MLNFHIPINVFATAMVIGLADGPTQIVHPSMMDICAERRLSLLPSF